MNAAASRRFAHRPEHPSSAELQLVARLRGTLALREMIQPVRTGYLGQDGPIDPKLLPRTLNSCSRTGS
jgi:hypothetical protein